MTTPNATEMVERIARAIGAVYDGYADPVDTPTNWARSMDATRAALEALREPSEAMVKEGGQALPRCLMTWAKAPPSALGST